MKNYTIAHIQTRWIKGGAEENVLENCRHQVRDGHSVYLIHGAEFDVEMIALAERLGVKTIRLDNLRNEIRPLAEIFSVIQMARVLRAIQADVVHTHNSKAGVIGRFAALLSGVRNVIHGVHIVPFANVGKLEAYVYISVEKLCSLFTSAYISVSPGVRDEFIRQGIGHARKHYVVYSAMDVGRFRDPALPSDWHELLGVREGERKPPTAVMLAAFEPRKRNIEFIRAIPQAFSGLSDWRVLFAGTGKTELEARELVSELGLDHRIRFAGYRNDPENIVALADVGVLTSTREGLPRVIVQFAAAGRPVVVSELAGIEDIVIPGVSGLITKSNDVSEAATAVANVLADADLREKLRAGTRLLDTDAWLPHRMNAEIDNVYRNVMQID